VLLNVSCTSPFKFLRVCSTNILSDFVPFYCEFFQMIVGDFIANINMDSSDEEPSSPQEENPLLKNDPPYDPRYLGCQLVVG
jgi:hypothetical protein